MNGFNPYLADVYASMVTPDPAMSVDTAPFGQPPPPPPPAPMPAMPPAGAPEPPSMLTGGGPAAPPANPFALPAGGLDAPIKAPSLAPMPSFAPPPAAPAAPSADAAPAAPAASAPDAPAPGMGLPVQPDVGAFPLLQASGGGTVPAHEVDMRGPTLRGQQNVMNTAAESAVNANTANSQQTAVDEYNVYLQQERDARLRQAAMEQSAAEREEELQNRQADFDSSVKQLSRMSLDPDRFYASRSTPQKVGALLSIALGGFVQGVHGGSNTGLDLVNSAIEKDIRAQEFAYHVAHDVTAAKQTAFTMAMQKYNNVDAARSMARASALDAAQAQIMQNAALWKDTDSANRANAAMAEIEANKAQQIAQGIRFLPATSRGRVWTDENGITYTEDQARAIAGKMRDNKFAAQTQVAGIGGKLLEAEAKAQADAAAKGSEHSVRLPSGEVILAGDPKTADGLRAAVISYKTSTSLIREAQQIRDEAATGVPLSPGKRGRLEQIQTDLLQQYAVAHNMGALSDKDYDNAKAGTADLFQYGPAPNARLNRLNERAAAGLNDYVSTIPGASRRAQGAMPADFTKPEKK